MFESISPAPPDAILGLTDAFKADTNPRKINLGVGVYKDESGQTPILTAVKKAEARLLEKETTKSYLPISGAQAYALGVQELLLGEGHALISEGRIQTAHTPGGTGGLRVGGDFLKKFRPDASIWVSNPTWANHKAVFQASGFTVKEYDYYDAAHQSLDFDAMLEALSTVPAGDVVLLHVCCHNPTGVDPRPAQWEKIAEVAEVAGWFPFFDFAYQGFGTSVEADRFPLELFAGKNLEFGVAASFSKNFGLYNERTGSFSIAGQEKAAVEAAFSHVKTVIRSNYSNPSRHGGAIVEEVLGDPALRQEWLEELDTMRDRIKELRTALVEGLSARGIDRDFGFIAEQNGMFSFSGLTPEQVKTLKEQNSIYIVGSGRINVAGINRDNLNPLCDAIAAVMD
ncbi:aspartate/tyrosine/aromatic aminotransferase [Kiritimatiellaeota bacterium B1221]|nr:aspartate/tyrosine/aromatic aminotransferase [Kiritimatiellaeota bacterium B1221]